MRASLLMSTFRAGLCIVAFFASAKGAQVDVQPRQQIVRRGEAARLMCRTGNKLLYCRMQGPGQRSWNLQPNINESDPSTPMYDGAGLEAGQCGMLLRSVSELDNGEWKCTMGMQNKSTEAVGSGVIVVAKQPVEPQLSISPSSTTSGGESRYEYQQGDSIYVSCTIPDGRPAANISWFIDDQPVTDGLSQVVITKGTVNDTWTVSQNLTRVATWQDNGKNLRCISQHMTLTRDSRNQSSVMLHVQYPPQPHTSPIEQFGFEVGQEGMIAVTIQANPKPELSWEIDGTQIREGSTDPENHYQAGPANNLGAGTWEATLRITRVEEQDIQKQYTLRASNKFGSETYKVALSTSSEPTVMELGAGSIIGIVVAILFVLLIIFLVIFARATGRWCFKAGVSSSRNDIRESSDTESADHGPANKAKKPKVNLSYIFNKKKDKVSDEPSETPKLESETQSATSPLQQKTGRGDIVYAELDLKNVTGQPRPQLRPEEDRTEYAEIVYTAKGKESDSQEK